MFQLLTLFIRQGVLVIPWLFICLTVSSQEIFKINTGDSVMYVMDKNSAQILLLKSQKGEVCEQRVEALEYTLGVLDESKQVLDSIQVVTARSLDEYRIAFKTLEVDYYTLDKRLELTEEKYLSVKKERNYAVGIIAIIISIFLIR